MGSARASDRARRAAILAVVLAGCANLDGLAGGAPDAASPPSDGGARDAFGAADASADASDAGTWCAQRSPTPAFCADFETTLVGGWSAANQVNGTLAQDGTDFVSPPFSMRSTTRATDAGGTAMASTDYFATARGSHVHLEYALRVGAIDPNANLKAGGFAIVTMDGNGPDAYDAFLIVSATGASLQESLLGDAGQPLFHATPLAQPISTRTWVRVQYDLVLPTPGGPSATVTVRFDDVVVLDQKPLYGGGANGQIAVVAGAEVYPSVAVGSCELETDDVLLTVAP